MGSPLFMSGSVGQLGSLDVMFSILWQFCDAVKRYRPIQRPSGLFHGGQWILTKMGRETMMPKLRGMFSRKKAKNRRRTHGLSPGGWA